MGEVRLRFEESLLIGERPRVGAPLPELFGVGAIACGVGALASLLTDGPFALAVALVLLAAGLTAASVISRGRLRTPFRFILNFATETLRLDAPGRTGRVDSELIPFDSVRDLRVAPTAHRRFGLVLDYAHSDGSTKSAWLVQQSPAAEIETLRRVWRILRHAFGLRPSAG